MINPAITNPQHALPGPQDIHRTVLNNGITVLARANFNSPSVFIHGYLATGSLFDPDEKLGLADFTASALLRGIAQHDFQQIYELLESSGASLGFAGGTHTSSFSGKALSEDLDLLLELLGEALRFPTFPPEHVDRLRAMLLTGLAVRAQDTGEMASLTFDQIVYAGHPYSRPEVGYPETIAAIHRQDLISFHKQTYGPNNMVIAVVGAVDPRQAVDRVSAALGDWENPSQPDLPLLPEVNYLNKPVTQKVALSGKSQADLVMGVPGPARRSPDFLSAAIANNILGQFGLFGRIGEAVRVKAGLAYYAYSSLSGGLGPGPWTAAAGVDPTHVDRVIALIIDEVTRMINEPVSLEELEDTQANFIGRLPLSLESNGGVAGALINLERHQLGLDYYQQYPVLVRAVNVQDVLSVAQNYLLPERFGIAVAGPD
jgi:zinc protease